MGTPSSEAVMEELRATLWARVGDATQQAVSDLAALVSELDEPLDDASRPDRGVALAHTVAGSAGVYGFRAEAAAASSLEALLRDWPGPAGVELARPFLRTLERGFELPA